MTFLQEIPRQGKRWGPLLVAGALAGLIASIPMAFSMMGLNQALPGKKADWLRSGKALPPRKISRRLLQRIGLSRRPRIGGNWDAATWLGHLGYGAAAASVYPLVTRPLHLPVVLRGVLFALGVWAISYLGWLPALGILPPATKNPARRNAIMVSSHVLWGALTALLTRLLLHLGERQGIVHLAGTVSAEDAGQSISP